MKTAFRIILLPLCLSAASLAVQAADEGHITVRKSPGKAQVLSNVDDDKGSEVLVRAAAKGKSESTAVPPSLPVQSHAGRDTAELPVPAGKLESDVPVVKEASKEEDKEKSAENGWGGAGLSGGSWASAYGQPQPQAGTQGSAEPAAGADDGTIMPNPRPVPKNAVPNTANTVSTDAQEKYRDRVLQEAGTAAAAGSPATVENPAVARRYLKIDRSGYQRRMGM